MSSAMANRGFGSIGVISPVLRFFFFEKDLNNGQKRGLGCGRFDDVRRAKRWDGDARAHKETISSCSGTVIELGFAWNGSMAGWSSFTPTNTASRTSSCNPGTWGGSCRWVQRGERRRGAISCMVPFSFRVSAGRSPMQWRNGNCERQMA
jgi:hypothetical protein